MGLWEKAPLRLRRYLVYRREGGWPPLALGPSVTVERLEKGLPLGLPEEVWADGRVYPLARTLEGYLALGHPGVVLRVEGRYAGHLFLRPPRGAQGALVALRPLQGGQRRRALRQPPSAQKRHGPKARERPTSEQ